jgi:hypothetical protein
MTVTLVGDIGSPLVCHLGSTWHNIAAESEYGVLFDFLRTMPDDLIHKWAEGERSED